MGVSHQRAGKPHISNSRSPSRSGMSRDDTASPEKHADTAPPDGGMVAWLQVLGSFFLFFNSWGLVNTFGAYQTYYEDVLLRTESNSTIAWIGSLRAFLLLASPIIWGPLFDLGHARILATSGAFFVVFGVMMTSLCRQFWQILLAQGVCVGLGSGALFLTGVAIVPTYFTSKKSVTMGIAASGSSLGGVLYPIIFRQLEPKVGFGWTVRVIAFLALVTSAVPCTTIRMRVKPEHQRKVFDLGVLKEFSFDIWSLAWFVANMGLYIPFFFIDQYATDVSGISKNISPYMLVIINSGSIFGRILPGLLADRTSPILVIVLCTLCSTILAFCWIAVRQTLAGLIVFCILYGFFSGSLVSLSTPMTVSLAPSLDGIGTRLGMFNFFGSLGILIGNPAAGAIVPKSWVGVQLLCGITAGLSCLLIVMTGLFSPQIPWSLKQFRGKPAL